MHLYINTTNISFPSICITVRLIYKLASYHSLLRCRGACTFQYGFFKAFSGIIQSYLSICTSHLWALLKYCFYFRLISFVVGCWLTLLVCSSGRSLVICCTPEPTVRPRGCEHLSASILFQFGSLLILFSNFQNAIFSSIGKSFSLLHLNSM